MNDYHRPLDREAIRTWLIDYIASVLDIPTKQFPSGEPFHSYGFDSVELVIMAGVMEEEFGVEIEPAMLFENPSVDALAAAVTAKFVRA